MQATYSVLNGTGPAAQLGVILDHVQKRKPRAEFFCQRNGLLRNEGRVLREVGGEQNLAQLQLQRGKIASALLEFWQFGASGDFRAHRQHRAWRVTKNVFR